MNFEDRLNLILEDNGIKKARLIRESGKNHQTIYNYCNGTTKPDMQFLRFLRVLIPDINLNWLLDGIGDKYISPRPQGPNGSRRKKTAKQTPVNSTAVASVGASQGVIFSQVQSEVTPEAVTVQGILQKLLDEFNGMNRRVLELEARMQSPESEEETERLRAARKQPVQPDKGKVRELPPRQDRKAA